MDFIAWLEQNQPEYYEENWKKLAAAGVLGAGMLAGCAGKPETKTIPPPKKPNPDSVQVQRKQMLDDLASGRIR